MDNYSRHEALHVARICTDFVSGELCDHPAIKANPKWSKMAEAAAELLADVYQAIGQEHWDEIDSIPLLDTGSKSCHFSHRRKNCNPPGEIRWRVFLWVIP